MMAAMHFVHCFLRPWPWATARRFCAGVLASGLLLPASVSAQALAPIPRYGYTVEEKLPMDRANFVQGLQIVDDRLYVGTGRYGESRLREYAFPAMTLERERALPAHLFGEGVTRFGPHIYQLTWRAGQILVYDAQTLEQVATHEVGTEGWGLTHDGESLIYSDGTPTLRFLEPGSLRQRREIAVTLAGRPLPRLNELEYVDGEIWANVWMANQLVRIDPNDGRVVGIVDLRGILDPADRAADTDVVNGIARDPKTGDLWVTGKYWPWLYRVEIREAPGT
jgi:glutamine cyclotransferase